MNRNDLITSHIPLVNSIANKFNLPSFKDDLIGEGSIALVKCADRFDSGRGVTFGQFAKIGIRRAMIKYIQKNNRTLGTESIDGKDENGVPFHSKLGNDGQATRCMIRDALRYYLHPVEEWVIVRRYFDKERFRDIAARLGFKETRVSQIHSNAIRKLKNAFSSSSPAAPEPQEESDDNQDALLQVVRKMMWDEWGVEVEL